ncbi:MAG: pyridoxal phosphate-dependent aminotransferase, partial [Oscillospiraceae bacterium]|nr:pyridoxal phosphate-dependent aminotransferase [Oscillospiraceae bacterium]
LTVHGYMPNDGFPAVRQTVAEYINETFGDNISGDNIVMTVGAAGGMNAILKALLNPGDEVLVPAPYFLEYGHYVENYGGTLVPVLSKEEDGFMPDIPALAAAINANTKAMILNNPNNPTGVIYPVEVIQALAAMLEEKSKEFGQPIYLISDEPYRELAFDGAEVAYLPKYYKNTIVGYSWSKSLSLPGERIGYLEIPPRIDDYELVRSAVSICARILGFVNAPSLMQLVVQRCIHESCDIAAYDNNRKLLYNGLSELGYTCAKPQGAFYLWLKTPTEEKEFVQEAKKHNILVVPGSSFKCPGYVRVAYCVSPDTIRGSMKGFAAMAETYGLKK